MSERENNSIIHPSRRNAPVLGGVIQVADKITELTSRLPLSGILLTKPLVLGLAKDRDTYLREMSYLPGFSLLTFLSIAHAYQASVGVDYLQQLIQTSSVEPLNALRFGIDASYALVNTGVVVTEGRLISRMIPRFMSNTRRVISGFREWSIPTSETNQQLYADRVLNLAVEGKQSELLPFFVLKTPDERRNILEVTKLKVTNLSDSESLEALARKSETLSRTKAVTDWVVQGLERPFQYKSTFSVGEGLYSVGFTLAGQIAFNVQRFL